MKKEAKQLILDMIPICRNGSANVILYPINGNGNESSVRLLDIANQSKTEKFIINHKIPVISIFTMNESRMINLEALIKYKICNNKIFMCFVNGEEQIINL